MERDLLVKFYEDFKNNTKEILKSVESFDDTILKDIQILTKTKKSFISESQIKEFWDDFKKEVIFDKVDSTMQEWKSQKIQQIKSVQDILCYLLEIFLDEFKIDEYNLDNIFKQNYKNLEAAFVKAKKSSNLDGTIEMIDNVVR